MDGVSERTNDEQTQKMDKNITCCSKFYIDENRKEHSLKWSCSSTESSSVRVWLGSFSSLDGKEKHNRE